MNEADPIKLGESTGVGLKKARQLKTAAANYIEEEKRLREELDAEKAAGGGAATGTEAPEAAAPEAPAAEAADQPV